MKSKFLLIGYIFILSLTQAQAQVTIALGDITGSRSPSKPGGSGFHLNLSTGLHVELKPVGTDIFKKIPIFIEPVVNFRTGTTRQG